MNNQQTPVSDLLDAKFVAFDKIFLDPNNPRIAPENPPGYSDDKALFDNGLQEKLEERVRAVYDVANLEDSILAHGWVPIDSIIVWEHPKRPDHHIVVEGNTRTVALRALRGERLDRERKKLEKLKKTPTRFGEEMRIQQGRSRPPREDRQPNGPAASLPGRRKIRRGTPVNPAETARRAPHQPCA